jgi:hypothetical protein
MSRPADDWEPVSGASTAILIGGSADALETAPNANAGSARAKATANVRALREMRILLRAGQQTG